jgi:hypothetical protein
LDLLIGVILHFLELFAIDFARILTKFLTSTNNILQLMQLDIWQLPLQADLV